MGYFASQPKPPESLSLADFPAKHGDNPDGSTSHLSETMSIGSFHYFSQLPMELQLHIWTAAARQQPDGGSRIFCTLPSTHRFAFTAQDANILYTISFQKRPLSSVFQICRNSREAAKKQYVLWPTDAATPRRQRRRIYVHLIHDTLFLRQTISQAVCLRATFGRQSKVLIRRRYTKSEAALEFLELLQSFRHLAVDWDIWWSLQRSDSLPLLWPQTLPSLAEILIILEVPDKSKVPTVFRSITPDTVRGEAADLIWSVVKQNREAFRQDFPGLNPPKIKVLALKAGDESSSEDEKVLEIMKAKQLSFPHYFGS
jgi:hypothetical protein